MCRKASRYKTLFQLLRLIGVGIAIALGLGCAKDHSYRFLTENDSYHPVERPDANYTSGISFTAIPAKVFKLGDDKTVDKFNIFQWGKYPRAVPMTLEYGVGQVFYTPDDVAVSNLEDIDRNGRVLSLDRPYAGFLYLQGAIHNHYGEEYDWTSDMRRSISAKVGLTGNGSLAEELHTSVHKSRDLTIPQGWDLQVGQVIGVTVGVEQRNRVLAYVKESWGTDVMTNVKASLGNIYSGLDAGVTLRVGWNLPRGYHQTTIAEAMVLKWPTPDDPETEPAEPDEEPEFEVEPEPEPEVEPEPLIELITDNEPKEKSWHLYGFVSHQNRWVFRDFSLDGRLLSSDTHTVAKEQVVNEFQYGAQLRFLKHWVFQALFAQRSKQFQNQRKEHSFGQYMLMYERPIESK